MSEALDSSADHRKAIVNTVGVLSHAQEVAA